MENVNQSSVIVVDDGMNKFLGGVFKNVGLGVGFAFVVAFLSYTAGFGPFISSTVMTIILAVASIVVLMGMSFFGRRFSATGLRNFYFLFSGIMGLLMTSVFAQYTLTEMITPFLSTIIIFVSASLYGYTTKKDLSNWGLFFMMALIGIIFALIINIFLASSVFATVISIATVVIFSGLTAYDVNNLKNIYNENPDAEDLEKLAVMGAVGLFLNFINLFQSLLSLSKD